MLHQIGNGALGPVFRAYDQDRDRLVAIKLFRLDLPPERVHQLVAEFEKLIAAELQHPVIAAPRATAIDGNSAYLAQDFAAADSLDIVIRENGAAPAAQVLRVAGQLADALDYAADRYIVHGALHPRDILLSQEDIRIVGLGIARALEHVGVTAPVRRPYAAPERINDSGWDRTADVFSLAAIVYELLTGKRVAGTGSDAAEGLQDVAGIGDGIHDIGAVQRVFALALASDPAYRYKTATAFTDALKSALGIEVVPAAEHEAAKPPKAKRPRQPRLHVVVPEVPGIPEVGVLAAEAIEIEPEPEPEPEPAPRPRRRRMPAPTPVAIETASIPIPEEPEAATLGDSTPIADVGPTFRSGAAIDEPVIAVDEPPPAFIAIEPEPEAEPEPEFKPAPLLGFDPEPEPEPELEAIHDPEPVHDLEPVDEQLFTNPTIPESPIPNPESTGSAVWPIGVAALIGIALGFGAGYTVAIRDRAAAPAAATPALPPPTVAAQPQPVGKEFTEVTAAQQPVSPKPAVDRAPAKADGRVLVRSTPSGARVIVDGKDRGQTPATIRDLPQGEHRIRVVRDGYTTAERRIVLSSKSSSQSLSVPLSKEPRSKISPKQAVDSAPAKAGAAASFGTLVIESRPQGATVLIDGRPVGTTPMSLADVRTGPHAVRLERDGYRIWTASVSISAGEQNRVTASLEK